MDRAAASSLHSRGKMALRASPGSLEVSSRRNWGCLFLCGYLLSQQICSSALMCTCLNSPHLDAAKS